MNFLQYFEPFIIEKSVNQVRYRICQRLELDGYGALYYLTFQVQFEWGEKTNSIFSSLVNSITGKSALQGLLVYTELR
jgi:hypothetical protein